jgi:hypothetical protein
MTTLDPSRDLRAIHLPCSPCHKPTAALARTIVAIDEPRMFEHDRLLSTWSAVCSTCIEPLITKLQPRTDQRCAMCPEPCYSRNETSWLLILTGRRSHYARLCKTHVAVVRQQLGLDDQELKGDAAILVGAALDVASVPSS